MPNVVKISDLEDAMTINEVAAAMKVHRATVEKLVKSRDLPSIRVGNGRGQYRISRRDLTEYLNAQRGRAG